MDRDAPVFLLWVIDKSKADNIGDARAAELKKIAKAIKKERNKEGKAGSGR